MAEKRYYWLKLRTDFYADDGPADFLMSQKDGANYVVLYQMLCLKSINSNGRLENQIGDYLIRYDLDKIQRDCKFFTKDFIERAIEVFLKLGIFKENNDGYIEITDYDKLIGESSDERGGAIYREWRYAVLERDGFCCRICGESGVPLHAHHIKPWNRYPEERFNVDNGMTMCAECHKRYHKANGYR